MTARAEGDELRGIRRIGLAAVELALQPRRIDQQRLRCRLACEGGKSHGPTSVGGSGIAITIQGHATLPPSDSSIIGARGTGFQGIASCPPAFAAAGAFR